ncbi:hypothetical protein ACTFIY_004848 [Dictyostelium cf. discoideum]
MTSTANLKNFLNKKAIEVIEILKSQEIATVETLNSISKSKSKGFKNPIESISKFLLKSKFSFINHPIDVSSHKSFFSKPDKDSGNTFVHVFCEKRESNKNLESGIENLKSLGPEIFIIKNKNKEIALFSTIKNQQLGLKIMHEFISRNLINIGFDDKEKLLAKCLEEDRVDMVKYLITIDFDLLPKLKRILPVIKVSPTTLEFIKLIKSVIQTIDEFNLPQIPVEIDDFFFVYNYQMGDFVKLIEIIPRYLNEISKIKIYPISQVSYERVEIGRGGNDTVYSGNLKEIDSQGKEISIPVVIKIPKQFIKSKLIEVYKELAIHQKVNGTCGPKLYGVVKLNVGFRFFFELALKMVITIRNLHKCHFNEVLHSDIKPHNWLVRKTKDELVIVLSDFGLSRENSETNENTLQKYKGTTAFIPPELNENILYNDKSDIYSLGVSYMMLLYKVVYGKMENPFYEFKITNMEYFKSVVALENFLVPIVPTFLPHSFKEFLLSTMNRIYTCRPNSEECIEIIKTLRVEYENDKTKWQVNSVIIKKEQSLLTDSIISQQLKLMNQVKKFEENDKFVLKKSKLNCSEDEIKKYLLTIIKCQE